MNLVYSEYAKQQLENIFYFLVTEQGLDFEKADEIKGEILSKILLLQHNPMIGQQEEYLEGMSQQIRRIVYSNYKILYFVDVDDILNTNIFDSRQDPEKMKG